MVMTERKAAGRDRSGNGLAEPERDQGRWIASRLPFFPPALACQLCM
jgi:hypothetical protein